MDLKVIETNNGGDLVRKSKDLQVIDGFQSMLYLAMFGGNVEESTPAIRQGDQQYFDWWGNDLFFPKNPSIQFNSQTERVLNTTPLTSSGRLKIENAVKKDLEFVQEYAEVSVTVTILKDDWVAIGVKIDQQKNIYLWDAANRELIDADFVVTSTGTVEYSIFDDTFDLSFE